MPGVPESAVLTWDQQKNRAKGGTHRGAMSLIDLLRDFGFQEREFQSEPALLQQRVPGDWIKRNDAAREDLLAALEKILNTELNLPISFTPRQVERDVFIASGTFQLHRVHPLWDLLHPLGSECGDDKIHLFVEKPDPADNIRGGGGSGNLDCFLNYVGHLGRIRIINAAKATAPEHLTWRQHSSAKRSRLRGDPALFEMLLKNITRQTSLQFKKDRRQERVWLVETAH